jgi:endoglucanase
MVLGQWAAVAVCCAVVVGCVASPAPPLRVRGNQLTDASTYQPIQLRGATGTGGNFACAQGWAILDGPTDGQYMAGMRSGGINVVRVPMNEDCWLGVNNVKPQYTGKVYQKAIKTYVASLIANGFNVVLTLHWSAPGTQVALGQSPMPDKDHSVAFWDQVSQAFGQQNEVIFDVFNEPYPGMNTWDSAEAWECWKHGGAQCKYIPFQVVGMDTLVALIRANNATNVLILGGINYSNSLTRWLEYMPADPLHNVAASWHSYSTNHCNTHQCWETVVKPVMAVVPVVTGELGENDCQGTYITTLMQWLDTNGGSHGSSYLAWAWYPWNCKTGPALITNYNGSCTNAYGCAYRQHLLSRR